MKNKASEYSSIWEEVQTSYIVHKNMLVEAYLHDKFIFKTCLMHPEFYARLMRDEQAKYHIDYMSPINELVLYGIPVKITPEVETISWIMDLDE